MNVNEFMRLLNSKIARTGDDNTLIDVHMTRGEWRALVARIAKDKSRSDMWITAEELYTSLALDKDGRDES